MKNECHSTLNLASPVSIPAVYSDRRQELLHEWINVSQWDGLKEKISAFKPDVVIYLARKMPRISEVLGWDFPDVLAVSDFAIPFMANELKGRRVAIVDDTVCMGSTLRNVARKVQGCEAAESQLFAIAKRISEKNEQLDDLLDGVPVVYSCKDGYQKEDYIKFSHNLAKSLLLLAKPYELEFPVYTLKYRNERLDQWKILEYLQNRFGASYVHCTTAGDDLDDTGLMRLTVDFYPEFSVNYKVRLYVDDVKKHVRFVPMASHHEKFCSPLCAQLDKACESLLANVRSGHETFEGETKVRCDQYVASMDFGLAVLGEFEELFDLSNVELEEEDALKLFGPSFVELLRTTGVSTLHGKPECGPIESANGEMTSIFFEKMADESQPNYMLFELIQERTKDLHSRALVFEALFEILAECGGEQGMNNFRVKDLVNVDKLKESPYLRLRIGATFGDLIKIFVKLWDNPDESFVRREVSRLLDQCIDNGCVVPVISLEGKRVYRKGEAPLFDASFVTVANLIAEHKQLQLVAPWNWHNVRDWPEKSKELIQKSLIFLDEQFA